MSTHRTYEARLITAAIVAVCGIACASAIVPAVEHTITAVLLVAGGFALLAVTIRLGLRWLRERREDRADEITAAAWRAQHAATRDAQGVA